MPSPSVLILNPYYTGLGIARCLRHANVEVIGLTSEADAPGNRSRFFDRVVRVPNGRDEPDALCAALIELGRTFRQKPVLLPTRDFDVLFVHDFWEALDPYYRLTQPRQSPILRMMDKLELARVADSAGVQVPRTVVCNDRDEVLRAAKEFSFPVVMKPRFAYQWRRGGIWTRIGAQKAVISESPAHLVGEYDRIGTVLSEVLIQEFVPGDDPDIVVCCCYIDERGDLLGHFTARKLRQEPALVGTGSVVQADRVDEIVEPTLRLLRAFEYAGMAEVEFKLDRASGRYFLIEINARHWDQHELGRLVDVNLSQIAYCHLAGQAQARQTPTYRPGERYCWIAERELCVGLVRNVGMRLLASGVPLKRRLGDAVELVGTTWSLTRGKRVFSVFALTDPLPSVAWALATIREIASSALGAMRRRLRPRQS